MSDGHVCIKCDCQFHFIGDIGYFVLFGKIQSESDAACELECAVSPHGIGIHPGYIPPSISGHLFRCMQLHVRIREQCCILLEIWIPEGEQKQESTVLMLVLEWGYLRLDEFGD